MSVEWQPSQNGGPPKFVEVPGSEQVGNKGGRARVVQLQPLPSRLGCGAALPHLAPSLPRALWQIIEADLVLLAMGFLGPEATLAEALGELLVDV